MIYPAFDQDAAQQKLHLIERLCAGHTDRREEAQILSLLQTAAPGELDYLLSRLPLPDLLGDIDDRLLGPQNKSALLRLLCRERLAELAVTTRAALVDALQRGRTSRREEQAIAEIFLGTRGAELTALKNAIEAGDDYHDLMQLLHHDIDDDALRQQILDHLRTGAAGPAGQRKILSDIDDTFYCNWKDCRYPKKAVYPGVLALYRELDLGPAEDGRLGDVVFLTARPGERTGLVEDTTRRSLRQRGVAGAGVICGAISHVLTNELIAAKKYEGFVAYQALFPEYDFVFLGDSGQGDILAGERMLAHESGAVRAVFIHDVVDTPPERRQALRAQRIYLHDTYVGAAADAWGLGLISRAGALRVAQAAQAELAAIPFADPALQAQRLAELQRDLARLSASVDPAPARL